MELIVFILLILAVFELFTIIYQNKSLKNIRDEHDRQVGLSFDLSKQNISLTKENTVLKSEYKKLTEENLAVNDIVKQQEKYIKELEHKEKNVEVKEIKEEEPKKTTAKKTTTKKTTTKKK